MDVFKRQWAFFDADSGEGGSGGDAGTGASTTEGAGTGDSWYSGMDLSDEQVGYVQNKGWDSPLQMMQSYQELEKFKGADEKSLIKIPEDPDSEDWAALYSRLGRPDTAAEYGLEMPDGMDAAEAIKSGFEEDAHAAGLNKAQTKALFDGYNTRNAALAAEILEAQKLEQETEIAELRKKWGEKGFNEREDMAKRMFRSLGTTDETSTQLEQLLGSAGLIRHYADLYERTTGKDGFVNSDGDASTGYGSTIEQVKASKETLLAEIGSEKKRNDDYIAGIGQDRIKMDALYDRLKQEGAKT